jgi:hypothetical protein
LPEIDLCRSWYGRQCCIVEGTLLRLEELLFPSIADVSVLSVDGMTRR